VLRSSAAESHRTAPIFLHRTPLLASHRLFHTVDISTSADADWLHA